MKFLPEIWCSDICGQLEITHTQQSTGPCQAKIDC